jgi:hypothetical protein
MLEKRNAQKSAFSAIFFLISKKEEQIVGMEGRKKENKPRFGSMCPFSFFKRLNTSIFGSFQKEKREKKRFNS